MSARGTFKGSRLEKAISLLMKTEVPKGCTRIPVTLYTGVDNGDYQYVDTEAIVPREAKDKLQKFIYCIIDGPAGTPYVSVRRTYKPSKEIKSLTRLLYGKKGNGTLTPYSFIDQNNILNWSPQNFMPRNEMSERPSIPKVQSLPDTRPRRKKAPSKDLVPVNQLSVDNIIFTMENGVTISGFTNEQQVLSLARELLSS